MQQRFLSFIAMILVSSCSLPGTPEPDEIRSEIRHRFSIPKQAECRAEDGLTESEAVALALLENPDFQLALSRLKISEADLIQAGQVRNPLFTTFLPVNTKAFEFTLLVPLDALLLRGARVENAALDARRVAALLTQGGLDLVRDVRLAFVRLKLARRNEEVLRERMKLARELADFDSRQLASGQLSEAAAVRSRVDSLDFARRRAEARTEIRLAENEVWRLLGRAGRPGPMILCDWSRPEMIELDREQALAFATRARPDLQAARLDLQLALDRSDLSWWEWLWLQLLFDYDKAKGESEKIGPGFQVELPIFHQNDAGKARAQAELVRVASELARQKNQLAADIERQQAICRQSYRSWRLWAVSALPEIETLARQAEIAFQAGETTFRPVLVSRDQLQQARAQEAGLRAALEAALAEFERILGGRAHRPLKGASQ